MILKKNSGVRIATGNACSTEDSTAGLGVQNYLWICRHLGNGHLAQSAVNEYLVQPRLNIGHEHDEIYRAATSPSKPLFFLTAGAEILWQARKQRSKQYWWLIINIVYQQTRFNIDDKHIEFLRVHLYQSLSSVDCANKASVHKQKSYHGNFYHCFWYRSQVFGQAFSDTLTQ